MASVKIENVTKKFGGVIAVNNLSLDIKEGEFMVFLGPSGCGKTTMLRIIAGLEAPTEGKIYIGNKDVTDLRPKQRNVAMVFQSYSLYPHMSAYENIAFPLKIAKEKKETIKNRVLETAKLLSIEDLLHKRPKEMSGGQSQRVAVGRAIVRKPTLFLFDEPLSNLDAKLRVQMRAELAHLHNELGVTSVYVTHDQVEAMTLGQRIAVLKDGVLQQVGKPMDIYEDPNNAFVASFLGSPSMNLLETDKFDFLSSYGKDRIVGIRPEDIEIVEKGIEAKLDVAELIGGEIILYLNLDGETITVKTDILEESLLKPGTRLNIKFNKDKIYLFKTDSGERIKNSWQPKAVS